MPKKTPLEGENTARLHLGPSSARQRHPWTKNTLTMTYAYTSTVYSNAAGAIDAGRCIGWEIRAQRYPKYATIVDSEATSNTNAQT